MGPFQGYFQVLSWKNGEDIQITFQFSIAEQTQFLDGAQTCIDTHTQNTHTGTSFVDPNKRVKCIPAPSDFLHLFPTDRIPLPAPGCYLSLRQQQTL